MSKPDVFLVTGCASGIGRAVTGQLARRGHRVLATDVNEQLLAEAAKEDDWTHARVVCRRLDVRDLQHWKVAIEEIESRWGRLDALLNVAGFLEPGWVHEFDPAAVAKHFDINVKGLILGSRLAAERMVKQGSGHIVNVASMAAFAPVPGLSLYSASKYAVRAFSLAAAIELREHGVAVTVVCPDAVATPMLDRQEDYREAAVTFTAPRVLSAEEVAREIVGPVLSKRPLEVAMPKRRKWLAKTADLVPEIGAIVRPWFERQGRARQRRRRGDD
jgi:3-oxoacyl-[acyl-carrier protein] reductase